MRQLRKIVLATLLIAAFCTAATAGVEPCPWINFQGVLRDADGNVVPDDSYDMTFRLYDVSSGGTALWTESQTATVVGGIFNAILGKTTPLDLPFDAPYWLGISINQGAELSPRIQLTASAYSLSARTVPDSVLTSAKIARSQVVKSVNALKL